MLLPDELLDEPLLPEEPVEEPVEPDELFEDEPLEELDELEPELFAEE